MTEPFIPRLETARTIVDKWRNVFGLNDWDIRVAVGVDMNGSTATCAAALNYDRALIELQPWVVGLTTPPASDVNSDHDVAHDDDRLEHVLVHELLHALMRRRSRAAQRMAEQLDEQLRPAFEQLMSDADEEIVDRLAAVLVRLSPSRAKADEYAILGGQHD